MRQETIHALMIRAARRGQRVVRLKGGDPFVFGRGGEEALALRAAGVPFEVIPGVSASIAAPALAGIPVTHRGVASAFTVVSGHAASAYEPVLDSMRPGAMTLVLLMAVAAQQEIAARAAGARLAAGDPGGARLRRLARRRRDVDGHARASSPRGRVRGSGPPRHARHRRRRPPARRPGGRGRGRPRARSGEMKSEENACLQLTIRRPTAARGSASPTRRTSTNSPRRSPGSSAGEIGPDAWRAFRLVRGTYGQRQAEDAQMLRVKIPQGVLTGAQLHALADVADRYSRGFGHITTRQNVQFHFMKLHDVEPAMRRWPTPA